MATMATSQMHSTLNVPPPGDDMEISSDAGQPDHYDDIDIDLMDPQDDDQDIDYMLEDEQEHTHQDIQASSRDDDMVDDLEDTIVVEEDMRDDEPDLQLTDVPDIYDDLQFQEHNETDTQENTQIPGPPQIEILEDPRQVDDQVAPDSESIPTSYPDADATNTQNTTSADDIPHGSSSQPTSLATPTESIKQTSLEHDKLGNEDVQNSDEAVAADLEVVSGTIVPSDAPAFTGESTDPSAASEQPEQQTVELGAAPTQQPTSPLELHVHEVEEIGEPLHVEQNLDVDADDVPEPEEFKSSSEGNVRENETEIHESEQSLHVDEASAHEGEPALDEESAWTYMHPVTVEYDGLRMSLFPPMEEDPSATYLLQDISVADKSIADLFVDCRHVLGQSIKEEDELEISCDELDLCISEVRDPTLPIDKRMCF
jgi:hypothetical protein